MQEKKEEPSFTAEQINDMLNQQFHFCSGCGQMSIFKKSLSFIIETIIENFADSVEMQLVKDKKIKTTDEQKQNFEKECKCRIAKTMLTLQKQYPDDYKNIYFCFSRNSNLYLKIGDKMKKTYDVDEPYIVMPILAQNGRKSLYLPPCRPFFTKDTECQEPLNGGYTTNNINIDEKTTTIKSLIKWPYKNGISIEFKTNEKNNITKVTIKIYKNVGNEKQYTISLNEEGKVQSITKKGEETDNNKYYKDEIKKLLYRDKINKHLTENIEYELDEEQGKVWNEIQSFLKTKIEENKVEEYSKNNEEQEQKEEEENNEINKRKREELQNSKEGEEEEKSNAGPIFEGVDNKVKKKEEENINNQEKEQELKTKEGENKETNKQEREELQNSKEGEEEKFNAGLKLEGVDDGAKKKINNHGICDSLKDCCTKFCSIA